jgi:hypothetical protein
MKISELFTNNALRKFVITLFFLYQSDILKAESFESPQNISVKKFLPAELFNDRDFTISLLAKNDGYMNTYTIKSKYINTQVKGNFFLMKMISEIKAINFIEDNFPSDVVFDKAIRGTAKKIITSPINATKKLINTVTDVDKLADTASSVPTGIVNLFGYVGNAIGDIASAGYQAGKEVIGSEQQSNNSQFDKHSEFVKEQALDFVGYNKSYREIAKLLKVDPYTENEYLRSELNRIASIESAVNIAGMFSPSFSISVVGSANSYLNYAEKVAVYEDPREIEKLNSQILNVLTTNSSDKSFGESAKLFLSNSSYSPPMRKSIIDVVKELSESGVTGHNHLILISAKAQSREEAQFYLDSISKISELNKKENGLDAIVTEILLPSVINKKKKLIIPLPVDYLVWTKDVSKVFNGIKMKIYKKYDIKGSEVLISGQLTPKCEEELKNLGIDFINTNIKF